MLPHMGVQRGNEGSQILCYRHRESGGGILLSTHTHTGMRVKGITSVYVGACLLSMRSGKNI